ncbi:extracellular solute-binding protein [Paenibacillus castaneae]|nr:extracellular solute-binding protein [Paenibacillus castaneae]
MQKSFRVLSLPLLLILLLTTSCQNNIIPVGINEKENLQGTLRIGLYSGNTWRNKSYEVGSRGYYQIQEKMKEFIKQNWDGAFAQVIDKARLNGEAYLLPVRSDPLVVYYNQALLDSQAIQAPQEGWTWESYAQMADMLNKANIPVGIPFDPNSIEPVVQSFGGVMSSPDNGKAVGYLDSDATTVAFSRYLKLMPKLTGMLIQPKQQPGLGFARASYLVGLLGDQQSDYRLAPMPVSEDGTKHNNSLLTGLAISKDSENKELAWKLLQFIAGDSNDTAMSFIADNTLRMQEASPAIEQSKWQELVELVKREATNAVPAAYDMVVGLSGSYGNGQFPIRSPEQLESIREGGAKQLLEEWARDIDAGISVIYKK